MENKNITGHCASALTILIWGTTFISTKILLVAFQPVEILFFRFTLGFLALWLLYPHRLRGTGRKQELTFAVAGMCGVCLYYLLENIALVYTMASNVGVIVSVSPFFTAVLSWLILKEEKPEVSFFAGFVLALAGIFLISFHGSGWSLNPVGDLLALLAAFVWACYSILTKKISEYGYRTIPVTRRTFAYGIFFMLPVLILSGFSPKLAELSVPIYLGNLLFLGLGASALCFVAWNFALRALGAAKASAYIYMVPVITVAASASVLHEPVSPSTIAGTLLTLAGLFLSESRGPWKRGKSNAKKNTTDNDRTDSL